MVEKKFLIKNKTGLHARPAALFIEIAERFEANVDITFDGITVNGKSIIGILSLGVGQGDEINLIIEGPDEEQTLAALEKVINNNFNEIY